MDDEPGSPVVYANWLYRVGSWLVDGLVVWAIAFAGFFLVHMLGFVDENGNPEGPGQVILVITALAFVAFAIWNGLVQPGLTGQSVGKQLLGMRLVSARSGLPIGVGRMFVRQLCNLINALPCYVGFLWPLWDARRQTLGDKIVGAVVVRDFGMGPAFTAQPSAARPRRS